MIEGKNDLLHQPLIVINVGLKDFAENMERQDVEVIQVDWSPPAGGDQELIDLLDELL
jgi:hypothetical protein